VAQVDVCSQISRKHINTAWAERTQLLNVKLLVHHVTSILRAGIACKCKVPSQRVCGTGNRLLQPFSAALLCDPNLHVRSSGYDSGTVSFTKCQIKGQRLATRTTNAHTHTHTHTHTTVDCVTSLSQYYRSTVHMSYQQCLPGNCGFCYMLFN